MADKNHIPNVAQAVQETPFGWICLSRSGVVRAWTQDFDQANSYHSDGLDMQPVYLHPASLNQSAPPALKESVEAEPLVTAQGGADTSDNAAPWGNSPREIQKRAMRARTAAIAAQSPAAPVEPDADLRDTVAAALCAAGGNGFLRDCTERTQKAYRIQADAVLSVLPAPPQSCSAGSDALPEPPSALTADDRDQDRAQLRSTSAATQQATGRYEFPYQRTFDAIAAATSIYAEGVGINVSVKAFQEAFNSHRDARPLAQPQSLPKLPSSDEIVNLIDSFTSPDQDTQKAFASHRRLWLVQCLQAALALSRPERCGGEHD